MGFESRIYLDTASSARLHPQARDVLTRAVESGYADPRRLHHGARNARLLLDNAREAVAECLQVRPDEVIFTPSGTHAVHLGVLGLLRGAGQTAVLTMSAVEHSSVGQAAAWHQHHTGAEVTHLPVDASGRVDLTQVPTLDSGVLAVQQANQEVGVLQPVDEVASGTSVPLMVDACAVAGRLPLPSSWSAAALSAHKWGGPAGVGVLLVAKGARWRPPFPHDERIDERSTGFEAVPAALAAAAALQAVRNEADELNARHAAMIDQIAALARSLDDIDVFFDDGPRLPNLLSFSCLYVDGEALVTELDRRGFEVASGSSCAATNLRPSHVLTAMGALTHGNVRISLGHETTQADVDAFCTALPEVIADVRRAAGVVQ